MYPSEKHEDLLNFQLPETHFELLSNSRGVKSMVCELGHSGSLSPSNVLSPDLHSAGNDLCIWNTCDNIMEVVEAYSFAYNNIMALLL